MQYHDLLNRIQTYAEAPEDESQDALEIVVENIAAHLNDLTRRDFAASLPKELHSAAMMMPTAGHLDEDIISQLMELEDLDESRAKRQIKAAWHALLDIFDSRAAEDIRSQLPTHMTAVLN